MALETMNTAEGEWEINSGSKQGSSCTVSLVAPNGSDSHLIDFHNGHCMVYLLRGLHEYSAYECLAMHELDSILSDKNLPCISDDIRESIENAFNGYFSTAA